MTKPQTLDSHLDAADVSDIARISQAMTRMRMMIGRRIIGRNVLRHAAPGLELSHVDAIDAVRRLSKGGEATVGAVAEMMRIDPSRGSRLVAELVQDGFLSRAVSQADARRSVIELTEKARGYFREAESYKRGLIETIVADWSSDDVHRFGTLFLEFIEGFETKAKLSEE